MGYSRREGLHPKDMGSESNRKATLRGVVPSQLCNEILDVLEKKLEEKK
jgi:hypothetical protein